MGLNDNAIFNVALYEATHGPIITVEEKDLVYVKDQDNDKIIHFPVNPLYKEFEEDMESQKELGTASLLGGIALAITSVAMPEIAVVAIPMILVGGLLLKSKRYLLDLSKWE